MPSCSGYYGWGGADAPPLPLVVPKKNISLANVSIFEFLYYPKLICMKQVVIPHKLFYSLLAGKSFICHC